MSWSEWLRLVLWFNLEWVDSQQVFHTKPIPSSSPWLSPMQAFWIAKRWVCFLAAWELGPEGTGRILEQVAAPFTHLLKCQQKGLPQRTSSWLVKLKEMMIFLSRWHKDKHLWFSFLFLTAFSRCGVWQDFCSKLHHELIFVCLFVCLFWANFRYLSALF